MKPLVFIKGGDGIVALAEWRRVVEVVGDLMEATQHYPVRYRVGVFPGEAPWPRWAWPRCRPSIHDVEPV
jgi:hypothetical protein